MRRAILLLTVLTAALFLGNVPALAATKTYTDEVRGVEISAGQIVGETRVGASFVGQASGGLPASMFASINYTPPRPGPGVTNTIVGGHWSLAGSWGVLFGSFTGGTVQWNRRGTVASVNANMTITDGRVKGRDVSGGVGSFAGTLSHRTFPPTIRGTLTLAPSFMVAASSR